MAHICLVFAAREVRGAEKETVDPLSEYNVVWTTPSKDHNGSMPIGNGETGVNLWVEPNGDLVLLISRTDSWDENERLCKLGRVRVKFDPPLVGGSFQQELRLREGEIAIRAGTGDQAINARVWVDANRQVIHVDADSKEAFHAQAALELWRNEEFTVDQYAFGKGTDGFKGPKTVYPDTVIGGNKERIAWYHRNSISPWKTSLDLQWLQPAMEFGGDPLLHRTFGGIIYGEGLANLDDNTLKTAVPRKNVSLSIHTHTQTPATESQWLKAVESRVEEEKALDDAQALQAHRKWWNEFWERSWIYVRQSKAAKDVAGLVPSNGHLFTMGMDTRGRSRLMGDLGRVSVMRRVLSLDEVATLASMRTQLPDDWKSDVLFSEAAPTRSAMPNSSTWTDDAPAMTLEAWVKPAAEAGYGRIIDKGTPGKNDGFLLDTYPGNSLRVIIGERILHVKDCLRADVWNHVAVTVDSGHDRIEIFLDGRLIAERGQPRTTDFVSEVFAVTRGYVLQRWISGCAGRGNFPIKFNGSLFTVNGTENDKTIIHPEDYRRWGGCYWFQNTRLMYWPMLASGDHDMMRPFFKMYLDILPISKLRTKIYFGHEGAFFPETISFWGTYQNGPYGWCWRTTGEPGDPTPNTYIRYHYNATLELLAMMIDYYRYTNDKAFFESALLPATDEFLLWWDQHWKRDGNGKLYMYPSSSCETYWECTNPTPDIAGLKWNIDQLLVMDGIDADRRARWEKLHRAIPEFPMREKEGASIISPAHAPLPKRTNLENPELYAVFPFRIFGVGKPDLELARDSFRLRDQKGNNGWHQDETQAAFLGLAETASNDLVSRARNKHAASRFPAFWGPNYDWNPDQTHGGNLLMALQAMILQADGGRIRLLPAWPKEWDCDFKLHAPDQTVVKGSVKDGKLVGYHVTPESRRKDVVVHEAQ